MISGRCAACKYLRRRCALDCIFSPYFPSNDPQRFACVHRIYGASNVAKMLQQIPDHLRAQATDTLYCEAQSRIQDPVYGCVGIISQLHQQIQNAETELAMTRAQMALFLTSNNTINHGHNNVRRLEQVDRFQEQQIGGGSSSNATFLPGEFDPNPAPNSWFL